MKLAVIGQSFFGAAVYKRLRDDGHTVTAVFTVLDGKRGADPLAAAALADGVPTHKIKRYRALRRNGGKTIPEVKALFEKASPDLLVLAFVTQFIPLDIVDLPKHGSICYHPSLLPLHRGASAINHALMQGDAKTGYSIFFCDDGLDTGDILLQKEVAIAPDDTISGLYKRWLFPQGVDGVSESVKLIATCEKNGTLVPRTKQPRSNAAPGASYEPLWKDRAKAEVDFTRAPTTSFTAAQQSLHNFIRGNDRALGAWATVDGVKVVLLQSTMAIPTGASAAKAASPAQVKVTLCGQRGSKMVAVVDSAGLLIGPSPAVLVQQIKVGASRKGISASEIVAAIAAEKRSAAEAKAAAMASPAEVVEKNGKDKK